jgi:hypothetical protein
MLLNGTKCRSTVQMPLNGTNAAQRCEYRSTKIGIANAAQPRKNI